MPSRAWFGAAVIVALAGLVTGPAFLPSSVTRAVGVLVMVVGLMPLAMLLARAPKRRRTAGLSYIAAGLLFGGAGFFLASRDDFLWLRLASIHWRILAGAGNTLAPFGWLATGVALALTGTGLLMAARTGAILSALVMILTAGYFTGSLTVTPYLRGRHLGLSLEWQSIAAACVLLMVALLLAIAALSRYPVSWVRAIPRHSGNPPAQERDRARTGNLTKIHRSRRWVKPVGWSTVGLTVVAGTGIWAWLTFASRIVVSEVFPDQTLAACVAHEIGKTGPSIMVSQYTLEQVRSLTCDGDHSETPATGTTPLARAGSALDGALDGSRIQSLHGLEELTNLVGLGLQNNAINDLTPLAGLENLGSLTLTNNNVADLAPLTGLKKLGVLKLTDNRVPDLTPLAGLPTLHNLGLSDNVVTDLTPLAKVRSLVDLGIARNQVADLGPLSELRLLSTLDASENRVTDVTPLAHLTQLSRLTLTANRIVTPAPLGNLPALSMLNITRNRIVDAKTFAGFTSLEELWVGGNQLTDVSPLAALPSLTGVDLEGNSLATPTGLEALRSRNIRVGGLA